MVLSNVSPRVKKRFPTLQHLVEAGKLQTFHNGSQDSNKIMHIPIGRSP